MTKKKSPAKKAVPKKKIVAPKQSTEWKVTAEYSHPDYPGSSIKIAEARSIPLGQVSDPMDIISKLVEENQLLTLKLQNKKQSEDMSNTVKASASPVTISSLLGELDKQVSRFYNGMNTIDSIADKLKSNVVPEEKVSNPTPDPIDTIGKLDSLVTTLNHLNNRLEASGAYIQSII